MSAGSAGRVFTFQPLFDLRGFQLGSAAPGRSAAGILVATWLVCLLRDRPGRLARLGSACLSAFPSVCLSVCLSRVWSLAARPDLHEPWDAYAPWAPDVCSEPIAPLAPGVAMATAKNSHFWPFSIKLGLDLQN